MPNIHLELGPEKCREITCAGLHRHQVGDSVLYSTKPQIETASDALELARTNTGIVVEETPEEYLLLTDPFRSVPVFLTRTEDGTVHAFSDFRTLNEIEVGSLSPDPVGCWGCLLFDAPPGHRTLLKGVYQTSSATKVTIDKASGSLQFCRYWDFRVEEDTSIRTPEQAAEGLQAHLLSAFARWIEAFSGDRLVLGLSGGMDSRVSAACLARHFPDVEIQTYTYGHDPRIREYKVASEICRRLEWSLPIFHFPIPRRRTPELHALRAGGVPISETPE